MHVINSRGARVIAGAVGAAAICLAAGPAWADLAPTPGATWGTNGTVTAMVTVGDTTVIGGDFTAVTDTTGASQPASHIAVVDTTTGAVDTSWPGSTDGEIDAMAVSGSTLFIGGKFNKVDGTSHRDLAALDLASGALVPGFDAAPQGGVLSLAATATSVYAGGLFTSVSSGSTIIGRPYVAKFDAVTGAVDPGWAPTPNARVQALSLSTDGSTLYLGGSFDEVDNVGLEFSAGVTTADPASLTSYRPRVGGEVKGSAYSNGVLYLAVGGNGGACGAVNAATGSQVWYKDADGDANAVTVIGGTAYCAGHFGELGGLSRHHLAAISTSAPYSIASFAPNVNSPLGVTALTTDGTNLYVGGYFTRIGGRAREHFAEFPAVP